MAIIQSLQASDYNWLTAKIAKVSWNRLVWQKTRKPKCAFITWLALQQKLLTRDRLQQFGVSCLQCVLCQIENEQHTHILFECCYTRTVLEHRLSEVLQVRFDAAKWGDRQQHALKLTGSWRQQDRFFMALTVILYQ